jgi:uncharacterized protein with ParB-like and HNH nuclease domain
MQSELKSLSKIFSEVIFRIPDYQRGYSWEEKHLKDFWNDLEQLEENSSHYTGVLTLEPAAEEAYKKWDDDLWIIESKHYSPMFVVDGQQRLTTAVILLQVILETVEEEEQINYTEKSEIKKKYIFETKDKGISKSYLFGYEKDNPSYEYLKQKIFCDSSIQHSTQEETIYTKNLARAKQYFESKISELAKEGIEKIFTKLTQHLQFNIFYIEKDLDVFVTFETMNNRGKPLSHLELLKNRLIYLSTKFNVDINESNLLRKAINESWKSIYHYLGKITDTRFSDDDFLETHYKFFFSLEALDDEESYSKFREAIGYRKQFKDILLENIFSAKKIKQPDSPLTIEYVFNYSQSIKNLVEVYYHTTSPENSSWPKAEIPIIQCINKLEIPQVFTITMGTLTAFKAGKDRTELLLAIERIGFLSKIKGYYFNTIDFTNLAITIINKLEPAQKLTKELNHICEEFVKSPDFIDAIREIGKNGHAGYYKWRAIRYFIYEYEQELKKLSKTSRELLEWSSSATETIDDHRTIEHIYPQKATDPYWKEKFSAYSIKEKNILKNSLGNLLPASKGKNSSLSNKSFNDKKGSEDNQIGYRYGCLSEIQVSMRDDWNAKEILRRGIYLLDFMERRWNLKIGNAMKKSEILGLKFVLEKENIKLSETGFGPTFIPKSEIKKVQTPNQI